MTPYTDGSIQATDLAEALTRTWPTDAHFGAYAPIELDVSDRPGVRAVIRARTSPRTGKEAAKDPNRDLTIFNVDQASLRMVALVGDIDDPAAHAAKRPASEEWRADVEPRLDASGLAWYRTTGGARVLATLDQPFVIDTPDRAAEWSARYIAWCDELQAAHGIELDRTCKDAARLFRLPNVLRGGKPTTASVQGRVPRMALPAPATNATTSSTTSSTTAAPAAGARPNAARAAAIGAILGALGPCTAWDNHKHELCGALGGMLRQDEWRREDCAELVRGWLTDATGAPMPGVRDVEAGVRWACGAWDKLSEEVSGRKALDAIVGADVGAAVSEAALLPRRARRDTPPEDKPAPAYADDLVFGELRPNPPRRTFVVPELEIGVGRAYGWLGQSNASKTLTLMQLEVDLALGRPVFGRFAGPGHPVPVLRIAWEGYDKAEQDFGRLLRGAGVPDKAFPDVAKILRYAPGPRFLGPDSADNVAWLRRVTARFGGGLVVLDPLVAACIGLDENSAEIAGPIYDLERVAHDNGVAFVVAHHLGHQHERSRGHSAIEGAFGANAIVSKVDGNGRQNHRLVTPHKLNRYGTDPFELVIHDTDEAGKPWTPTAETRARGECSWALAVRAKDAPPVARETKEGKRAAAIQEKAAAIRDALADTSSGVQVRLGVEQARSLAAVRGDDWPAVRGLLKRMGVKEETHGRSVKLYLPPPTAPRPAAFAAPDRSSYTGLPEPS